MSDIFIARGKNWGTKNWQEHVAGLQKSAEQTEEKLAELGVFTKSLIIATVHRRYPGEENTYGWAYRPNRYDINLGAFGTSVTEQLWQKTVSVQAHEVVHCNRSKKYPISKQGWLEKAASEGLAYNVQQLVLDEDEGLGEMSDVLNASYLMVEPIRSFLQEKIINGDPDQVRYHFTQRKMHSPFARGELAGAVIVAEQLRRGAAIAELIELPAQEVLFL